MEDTTLPNFGFIVVPKSCDDPDLWSMLIQKWKAFRLGSLKESPEAFASTYGREVLFADEIWAARLANPRATMLVTVKDTSDTGAGDAVAEDAFRKVRALVELEWLAATVLIEQTAGALANFSATKSPWQMIASLNEVPGTPIMVHKIVIILNGVYVAPNFRKCGLGKATLKEAFAIGRSLTEAQGQKEIRFQVRVDIANRAACGLYDKVGFREVGREQLHVLDAHADGVAFHRTATVAVLDRPVSVSDE